MKNNTKRFLSRWVDVLLFTAQCNSNIIEIDWNRNKLIISRTTNDTGNEILNKTFYWTTSEEGNCAH